MFCVAWRDLYSECVLSFSPRDGWLGRGSVSVSSTTFPSVAMRLSGGNRKIAKDQ
jgi:hypothetical protein